MKIIGRKKEIEQLEKIYDSHKNEFVAITGRRRVGKTYLVSQLFENRITFYHVGISPNKLKEDEKRRKIDVQLEAFYASLLIRGYKNNKRPKNWFEAFSMLIDFLESKKDEERILIFIDELPWLDTPKSNFISAFEWFWNIYGANKSSLMLITCGSSTSWMLNKVINSHEGLYDRITYSIHLSPFTLGECEQFFNEKGYHLSKYMIATVYMVLGGIPYYLNYYQPTQSINQTIDELFFKGGKLSLEYDNLFESSFDKEKLTRRIVEFLADRKKGYTRKQLVESLDISDGDDVGSVLKALINSDFIREYTPYGESKKNKYYKVIDSFCLFYIHNVKNNTSIDKNPFNDDASSKWIGSAFENICAYHLDTIKNKLGINGIKTLQFSLFVEPDEENRGAQIDLLIERKDKTIHLIEMKFYDKEFSVDKSYHLNLMNKIDRVKSLSKNRSTIYLNLVTTFGLSKNEYFGDFVECITLDDLFM